jgi:hypothetical protein
MPYDRERVPAAAAALIAELRVAVMAREVRQRSDEEPFHHAPEEQDASALVFFKGRKAMLLL